MWRHGWCYAALGKYIHSFSDSVFYFIESLKSVLPMCGLKTHHLLPLHNEASQRLSRRWCSNELRLSWLPHFTGRFLSKFISNFWCFLNLRRTLTWRRELPNCYSVLLMVMSSVCWSVFLSCLSKHQFEYPSTCLNCLSFICVTKTPAIEFLHPSSFYRFQKQFLPV